MKNFNTVDKIFRNNVTDHFIYINISLECCNIQGILDYLCHVILIN